MEFRHRGEVGEITAKTNEKGEPKVTAVIDNMPVEILGIEAEKVYQEISKGDFVEANGMIVREYDNPYGVKIDMGLKAIAKTIELR